MKKTRKTLLLIGLIGATFTSLTGCKPAEKARVTYGTLVGTTATELKYGDFATRVNRGENMLISVYDDSGVPCGCWTTFHTVIDQYVDKYDTVVYYIGRSQFSEDSEKYGLTILGVGTDPTFAFIKDGKKTNEYIYGKDTKPMFTDVETLRSAVNKIARDPQYMLVDQTYLDNKLFKENSGKVIIHYIWNFCPDCNDCFPRVMIPYSEKNDFKTKVWIIDLAIAGILLDENGQWQGTSLPSYVSFLKEHQMSAAGNETFGYDRGFVPTTQVWENGVLKDMNVYFNDSVSYENGKYTVSQSYYTTERVNNLAYTNTVLQDLEITADDVEGNETDGFSWKKESAAVYHQPILEAFLDKYTK